MTEYEIADLTTSVMGNYLTAFSVFITLISAYVIAAFVAGVRLSRAQVTFVNLCFITLTTVTSLVCATMLARALTLNLMSPLADLGGLPLGPRYAFSTTGVMNASIIVGCVWFMGRVRKNEA